MTKEQFVEKWTCENVNVYKGLVRWSDQWLGQMYEMIQDAVYIHVVDATPEANKTKKEKN